MNPIDSEPTVAGLVTPPGVGGMAVVQVIGSEALTLSCRFLRNLNDDRPPHLRPNRPRLLRWIDDQEHLDDVVAVAGTRGAPRPTVCINTHGSVRVVERILMGLESAGAEIVAQLPTAALWYELTPVECAVMTHLPRAQTRRIARWLIDQVSELPAAVEACLNQLKRGEFSSAVARLADLQRTYSASQVLLDGARVVIVGPPNAGKSTLANRLFERPWSIESDQAGTTLDWVHQTTVVRGLPITLADTAGLRDSGDPVEVEAINKAHPIIREADVQILVLDARHPESHMPDGRLVNFLQPGRLIVVLNKRDLLPRPDPRLNTSNLGTSRVVLVSALMNEGVEDLRDAILRTLDLEPDSLPAPAIWDPRQLDAITAARSVAGQDVAEAATRLRREFCPLGARNGGFAGL